MRAGGVAAEADGQGGVAEDGRELVAEGHAKNTEADSRELNGASASRCVLLSVQDMKLFSLLDILAVDAMAVVEHLAADDVIGVVEDDILRDAGSSGLLLKL